MHKTLATLLVAAAFSAPFAQADTNALTVELTYDRALLQTESGVELVLASLETQATEACAYASPITGAPKQDRVCRDEVMKKAVAEIRRVSLEEGTATTSVFASLETPVAVPAQ
ncbi:MAG: UrcA family protein [Pseudomonadota bacterium]